MEQLDLQLNFAKRLHFLAHNVAMSSKEILQ